MAVGLGCLEPSGTPHRYHAGRMRAQMGRLPRLHQSPVTGGTIVQLAMDAGLGAGAQAARELDWDDTIPDRQRPASWWTRTGSRGRRSGSRKHWDPAGQLIRYLETLFEAGENVGYVTAELGENQSKKGTRRLPQDKGKLETGLRGS